MTTYKLSICRSIPPVKKVFLPAILSCIFLISSRSCSAQNSTPDLSVVIEALKAKRDSVNRVNAEYLMEYYLSPSNQREYDKISSAAFEKAKIEDHAPADAKKPEEIYDRIATCRYQSRNQQWREDVTEAFPSAGGRLLTHFHGFDGERSFAYDAARFYAVVGATENEVRSGSVRYGNVMGGIRYAGFMEPVTILEAVSKLKMGIKPSVSEKVNGESCIKYTISVSPRANLYERQALWVCPDKGYSVVRWRSEIFAKNAEGKFYDSNVTVWNVFELQKTGSNFYVNKRCEEDNFQAQHDGVLHWQDSHRYTLHSIELNGTVPATTFVVSFPPGTRVDDRILNPDHIVVSGADPGSLPLLVSKGQKLLPEPLEGTSVPQPQIGEFF